MNKIIYCIDKRHPEKIKPYRVDKETDKMYYAHEIQYCNGEEIPNGWSRSIKKSVMHLDWHGHFYDTLEEAKAAQIETVKKSIAEKENYKLETDNAIKNLTELLEKLEGKDER